MTTELAYKIPLGATLNQLSQRLGLDKQDILDGNAQITDENLIVADSYLTLNFPDSRVQSYTVQTGDTCCRISQKFGMTFQDLVALNSELYEDPQTNHLNLIEPGMTFWVVRPKIDDAIAEGPVQKAIKQFGEMTAYLDQTYQDALSGNLNPENDINFTPLSPDYFLASAQNVSAEENPFAFDSGEYLDALYEAYVPIHSDQDDEVVVVEQQEQRPVVSEEQLQPVVVIHDEPEEPEEPALELVAEHMEPPVVDAEPVLHPDPEEPIIVADEHLELGVKEVLVSAEPKTLIPEEVQSGSLGMQFAYLASLDFVGVAGVDAVLANAEAKKDYIAKIDEHFGVATRNTFLTLVQHGIQDPEELESYGNTLDAFYSELTGHKAYRRRRGRGAEAAVNRTMAAFKALYMKKVPSAAAIASAHTLPEWLDSYDQGDRRLGDCKTSSLLLSYALQRQEVPVRFENGYIDVEPNWLESSQTGHVWLSYQDGQENWVGIDATLMMRVSDIERNPKLLAQTSVIRNPSYASELESVTFVSEAASTMTNQGLVGRYRGLEQAEDGDSQGLELLYQQFLADLSLEPKDLTRVEALATLEARMGQDLHQQSYDTNFFNVPGRIQKAREAASWYAGASARLIAIKDGYQGFRKKEVYERALSFALHAYSLHESDDHEALVQSLLFELAQTYPEPVEFGSIVDGALLVGLAENQNLDGVARSQARDTKAYYLGQVVSRMDWNQFASAQLAELSTELTAPRNFQLTARMDDHAQHAL